jgi:hypothetical protein
MIECKSNTLFCNKQRISRFIFPIFCISCRLVQWHNGAIESCFYLLNRARYIIT